MFCSQFRNCSLPCIARSSHIPHPIHANEGVYGCEKGRAVKGRASTRCSCKHESSPASGEHAGSYERRGCCCCPQRPGICPAAFACPGTAVPQSCCHPWVRPSPCGQKQALQQQLTPPLDCQPVTVKQSWLSYKPSGIDVRLEADRQGLLKELQEVTECDGRDVD